MTIAFSPSALQANPATQISSAVQVAVVTNPSLWASRAQAEVPHAPERRPVQTPNYKHIIIQNSADARQIEGSSVHDVLQGYLRELKNGNAAAYGQIQLLLEHTGIKPSSLFPEGTSNEIAHGQLQELHVKAVPFHYQNRVNRDQADLATIRVQQRREEQNWSFSI